MWLLNIDRLYLQMVVLDYQLFHCVSDGVSKVDLYESLHFLTCVSFPRDLPPGTAVPSWAYEDVTVSIDTSLTMISHSSTFSKCRRTTCLISPLLKPC